MRISTIFPEADAPLMLGENFEGACIITSTTAEPAISGVGVGGRRRVRQS